MRKSVEGEEGCGSEGVRFGKGDIQGKGLWVQLPKDRKSVV